VPTFIDESGETGQVSPYFRLAAVWLPTQATVEAYRAGIRQFQQKAGLAGYEYKSSRSLSQERRIAYFQAAMGYPFRFAVASVDKQDPEWRAAGGSVMHWACAVSLAVSLRTVYLEEEARRAATGGRHHPLNELVVLDNNQDGKFLAVIKQKFRELRSGVRAGSPLGGGLPRRRQNVLQHNIRKGFGDNAHPMKETRRGGQLTIPPRRSRSAQSPELPNPVRSRSIHSY
jgi:hypothetical protein